MQHEPFVSFPRNPRLQVIGLLEEQRQPRLYMVAVKFGLNLLEEVWGERGRERERLTFTSELAFLAVLPLSKCLTEGQVSTVSKALP